MAASGVGESAPLPAVSDATVCGAVVGVGLLDRVLTGEGLLAGVLAVDVAAVAGFRLVEAADAGFDDA